MSEQKNKFTSQNPRQRKLKMIQEIYSIRDNKMESYERPMFYMNEELCIANIRIAINDVQTPIQKPVDYDLYHLGSYNSITGKIETFEAPKHLLNCESLAIKYEEKDPCSNKEINKRKEKRQSIIEPDNNNPLTKVKN